MLILKESVKVMYMHSESSLPIQKCCKIRCSSKDYCKCWDFFWTLRTYFLLVIIWICEE